jgi:hypothetical protein
VGGDLFQAKIGKRTAVENLIHELEKKHCYVTEYRKQVVILDVFF